MDTSATTRMPPPAVIPAGSSVFGQDDISILSYNILLPNSVDGWWVYKMYSYRHHVCAENTSWEVRKALLRSEIATANTDIVCFQEVSADSFDNDFSFMEELGYDCSEMYKRGRFRPATFWKSSRVCAVAPPQHRDRVLVIPFQRVTLHSVPQSEKQSRDEEKPNPLESASIATTCTTFTPPIIPDLELPLYVANCHLQAGEHAAERRLRQMHDVLDNIRKDATKSVQSYLTTTNKTINSFKKSQKKRIQKLKAAAKDDGKDEGMVEATEVVLDLPWACELSLEEVLLRVPVVVLGDMNCDPNDESAAHALLLHGEASVGEPKAKPKRQMLGSFVDAYEFAYTGIGGEPPPTMICEHLYGVITDPIEPQFQNKQQENEMEERHLLSDMAVSSIRGMFEKFATKKLRNGSDDFVMCSSDIKKWLEVINLASNRGSELRGALARMKVEEVDDSDTTSAGESAGILELSATDDDGAYLDWAGFKDLYEQTVNEGKVWSVSWDLAACGFPVNPSSNAVFSARYDRAYVSLGWMNQRQQQRQVAGSSSSPQALVAVSDLGVGSVQEGCLGVGGCLPNSYHPSDHLPIALAIRL